MPANLQTLLSGKTAITTGPARGIGQAIVAFYAAADSNIIAVDIDIALGSNARCTA